jgi:hypothetical protein
MLETIIQDLNNFAGLYLELFHRKRLNQTRTQMKFLQIILYYHIY